MFERKCEYEDVPYLLSEVDRLNALHKREIIITGEYAQRVIDLAARAEAAAARADAAVEDMTAVLTMTTKALNGAARRRPNDDWGAVQAPAEGDGCHAERAR